jgi:hypothetical protein
MGKERKNANRIQRGNSPGVNHGFCFFQESPCGLSILIVNAEDYVYGGVFEGDLIYKFNVDSMLCQPLEYFPDIFLIGNG